MSDKKRLEVRVEGTSASEINIEDSMIFATKEVSAHKSKITYNEIPKVVDEDRDYDLVFIKKTSIIRGYAQIKGRDIQEMMKKFKVQEEDYFVIADFGRYRKMILNREN